MDFSAQTPSNVMAQSQQQPLKQINLRKNILISGGFRALIMVFSVLLGWVSTRYLGVFFKGQYSFLTTTNNFIWMLLSLGVSLTIPYQIRKQHDKTTEILRFCLIEFVLEVFFLLSLANLFLPFWSDLTGISFTPALISVVALIIPVTKLAQHLQAINLGLDNVFKNSLIQLAKVVLNFILVGIAWLFLHNEQKLLLVLLIILFTEFASIFPYLQKLSFSGFRKRFDFPFIYSTYQKGINVFLSTFFILLLIRFDVILIKFFTGFSQVGIYAVAASIIDMLQMASNLVGSLMLVKLSSSEDDAVNWSVLKKALMSFMLLLTAANIVFVVIGRVVIQVMYGAEFVHAWYVYLWLIPAGYGLSYGSLLNTYLWSKGFPKISILFPLIALCVNIVLNIFMIPAFGIKGAAVATSIAYILWFLLITFYEQKKSQGRFIRSLIPTSADWNELIRSGWQSLHFLRRR